VLASPSVVTLLPHGFRARVSERKAVFFVKLEWLSFLCIKPVFVEGTTRIYNLCSIPSLNQNPVYILQFVSGRLFWYSLKYLVVLVVIPSVLSDCVPRLEKPEAD
jgi:hypothetical protein